MVVERCQHLWERRENYLVCTKCSKQVLYLTKINELVADGKRKDGTKYTVRHNRHRYFFPGEWKLFINSFTDDKAELLFLTCLYTGGRIMEVLHLKASDFNFDRETVRFRIIKQRKAKRTFYATGKTREFFVSKIFLKKAKAYVRKYHNATDGYLFLDKDKLPENYESLNNEERKKYYKSSSTLYHMLMKAHMKKTGISDWYNFSLHNIRKTYGNWMRTFSNITVTELCFRLGHDAQTYEAHYGSSLIFNPDERKEIADLFGEVK